MRVLFDTNVILDVLLDRQPWVDDASAIWKLNDAGALQGFIPASTFTDIYYIARRLTGTDTALRAIHICLNAFDVCAVDKAIIAQAVTLPGKDFEDNVLIACAVTNGIDTVVTRNVDDFADSPVAVSTPTSLLAQLSDS